MAAALALWLSATAALPATRADRSGPGKVVQVTRERAYLDRGKAEGLLPGQSVQLLSGRAQQECRIEWVADHHSTCVGARPKLGDRFLLEPRPAATPVRLLPPHPSAGELARRRRLMLESPYLPVRFAEKPRQAPLLFARASLRHESWATVSSGRGPFHEERLDLAFAGLGIGGATAQLDLTVQGWSRRPDSFRMPLRTPYSLRVRQAEVSLRGGQRTWVGSAGRTFLRQAPGGSVFDGVQLGFRQGGKGRELGMFAGSLPIPFSLDPAFEAWTAGAYFTQSFDGPARSARSARLDGRLAVVLTSAAGRLEAEAAAHAWLSRQSSAHASLLLAIGTPSGPTPIEAARIELDLRPVDRVPVRLQARYDSGFSGEALELGARAVGRRSLRADARVGLEPAGWLQVEVLGGAVENLADGLFEGRCGGEVSLSSLLQGKGAIALGHQEELGWVPGRSSYAQLVFNPSASVRVLARLTLSRQLATGPSVGESGTAGSLYLSVDARLFSRLRLRGTASGLRELSAPARYGPAPASSLHASLTVGADL